MTEKTVPGGTRVQWKRLLLGTLISILTLVFLFQYFDWGQVFEVLRRAEWGYLLVGLSIYLLSYGMRAIAWRALLSEAVSLRRVFLVMNVGYLLNNILPFRLGELGRAYLLGQDGLGFWRVFSTILIERAFDLIIAAGLLLGTLPFVLQSSNAYHLALVVGGAVLLGLLALYLLARNKEWALAQYGRLGRRWPLVLRIGQERLGAFLDGLETLTSLGRFAKVFGWLAFSWAAVIVVQYLILRSFYPQARVLHAAFGFGVSSLGAAVPSSPGYIGVYEAAVVGALALFEIPFPTAFAHALTAHAAYILVTGIFGAYGLTVSSAGLGAIFKALQRLRVKR
jgi:uncharacterized protein (TIRG00374 family)